MSIWLLPTSSLGLGLCRMIMLGETRHVPLSMVVSRGLICIVLVRIVRRRQGLHRVKSELSWLIPIISYCFGSSTDRVGKALRRNVRAVILKELFRARFVVCLLVESIRSVAV